MKCPIEISLLGGVGVADSEGSPIDLRGKKARALLAYLAATPGQKRSRERLASLLWGDLPDERARQSLRQCLSSLRKALGTHCDILDVDADGVVLRAESADIDAHRFRLAAESDDATRWQRALDSYRGEFLDGLALAEVEFDDWLMGERRELERLAGRLCLLLAKHFMSTGLDSDAERVLRRRLELDPCSEEGHRALMQLLARTGRRAQALQQYESCRDALQRELDTTPSAHTQRLWQKLRGSHELLEVGEAPLPLPSKPSIAVLPFGNVAGDREQSYFSDGIAEDIIVALSRFDAIMVIARNSTFSYRDRAADVTEIGRTLGVHYVLQGSVRRGTDLLRVSAQLIDAAHGATVWANTYDRPLQDVFALQDELVQTIVATLADRLESHTVSKVRLRPTNSLEAYECLLKGKFHHHLHSVQDNVQAQNCLTRALDLDPNFAAAHAWLACVLAQSVSFGAEVGTFKRAYASALRARQLNDSDSECHRILAAYYLIQRRYDDCRLHQERAYSLNPNDDRIVAQWGEILSYLGEADEAVEWHEKAIRLNPFHADGYSYDYGRALFHAGRLPEALAALRKIASPRVGHHLFVAATCQKLGRLDEARRAVTDAMTLRPEINIARHIEGMPYRDRSVVAELSALLAEIESIRDDR